ncbi:MAG: SDR family oxidoreductase [Burkholderiaceae bacterium]|nr:SDR family oxidoreductase [Burkholderiaceae bacterium]
MQHMANVLITGHSRGLGAALTAQLLGEGHRVLGISRMPALGLGHAPRDQFHELSLNLGQPSALSQFLNSSIVTDFFKNAQKSILINNAGLLGPIGAFGGLDHEQILQSITVNVGAVLALSNQFIGATLRCPDRRIVHISSGAGRSAYAGWGVYCASKAALDHHARCLTLEHPLGLRIESIAPGIIDTGMQAQIRATSLDQFPMRPKFDQLKENGALAAPEAVARKLIKHLLGDQFGTEPCTDLRDS